MLVGGIQLRELLCIPAGTEVTFERYSDSAETYMLLDSENPYVYKQLYRAAKAKLKLRIKASIMTTPPTYEANNVATNSQPKQESAPPRYNFLDTVLRPPVAEPKQTMSLGQLINMEASKSAETAVPPHVEESSRERTSQPPTEDLYSDDLSGPVCVDCNSCGKPVSNEHYHCSICDAGDYDLCQPCVSSGVSCHGEDHWLIKRVIENGVIVSSATETIAPKQTCELREKFPENDRLSALLKNDDIERTCNACFQGKSLNRELFIYFFFFCSMLTLRKTLKNPNLLLAINVLTLISVSPALLKTCTAITPVTHSRSYNLLPSLTLKIKY